MKGGGNLIIGAAFYIDGGGGGGGGGGGRPPPNAMVDPPLVTPHLVLQVGWCHPFTPGGSKASIASSSYITR